ncbi:GIY-YIG domain-containing protein [Rhizobium sp. G187]|uniref:GIY-YIG domain-containing protein n=1 Tax=Rhizobium sp. G187 TaxID=3451352 RepID=UPI003EE7BEE0
MIAEENGSSIYFSLMQAGGVNQVFGGSMHEVVQGLKALPDNQGGVYSIWMSTTNDLNKFIPVYLGYTSRNFRVRMQEHCQKGAIHLMYSNPIAKPAGGIGIVYLNVDWAAARAVEAVLLEGFDFAYNTADNGTIRHLTMGGWSEADLQEDPEMPTEAGQIETFNSIVGAFETLSQATQGLYQHFASLKH